MSEGKPGQMFAHNAAGEVIWNALSQITPDKIAPRPTGELRWARVGYDGGGHLVSPSRLQQLWQFADGRTEWRDVPVAEG